MNSCWNQRRGLLHAATHRNLAPFEPQGEVFRKGWLGAKKKWFWINVFNVCWIMLSGFYGFLYGVLGCLRSVDCFFYAVSMFFFCALLYVC